MMSVSRSITAMYTNGYPDVPSKVLSDSDVALMSDSEIWGTLFSISLKEKMSGIDSVNRLMLLSEVHERHPEMCKPRVERGWSAKTPTLNRNKSLHISNIGNEKTSIPVSVSPGDTQQ